MKKKDFHTGLPGDPQDQNLAFQVIKIIWNLVRVYNFHVGNIQFVSIREGRGCLSFFFFSFLLVCYSIHTCQKMSECLFQE